MNKPLPCVPEIVAAAGGQLSDEDTLTLMKELQRRIRERERLNQFETRDEAVRAAADDYAKEMAQAAIIENRNAAINLKIRLQRRQGIDASFKDAPELGLQSTLVGSNADRSGSRLSAAVAIKTAEEHYVSVLTSGLIESKLTAAWASGAYEREVSDFLESVNRGDPKPIKVSREAEGIAKVVMKATDLARVEANKAGAWIKKMDGWIVRQSHDPFKIAKAKYEGWSAYVRPRLDWARIGLEDGETQDQFLKSVYAGLSSGVHLTTQDVGPPSGFKGFGNIAKRASEGRVLHFLPGKWFDYNATFGMGNLREAVLNGLRKSAQDTGLMKVWGTNPQDNFARVANDIALDLKKNAPDKLAAFQQKLNGPLKYQMRTIDGTVRMPVNHTGAKVFSFLRGVQTTAKLGAALFSQFSDIGQYASEMRYQGKNQLEGMAESMTAPLRGVQAAHRAELYGALEVYFDSMIGNVRNRFSLADDGISGGMARMQQMFIKLTGMRWWSENQRASALLAMSHRLGLATGKEFGALEPHLQRVLGLFGIDEGRWGLLRQAATKEVDGRSYMTSEGVRALPDDAVSAYLQEQGVKPTAKRIDDMRNELGDQLHAYYIDRASFAQMEPDASTQATMLRGTQPGTVEGEMLRMIGQFKSFSFATVQKGLGRELRGRGANPNDPFYKALFNGNGEMAGLALSIGTMTLLGYGSMVAKDLLKGRTPRDPRDWRTWTAAAAQGGGAGLYGDFLFGQASRQGGGIIESVAGPVPGMIGGLDQIRQDLLDGTLSHPKREAAADAFRWAINNTPFINLFYTRMALDYLILYGIQDALSPGYLQRLEQRTKKQNGQTFMLRPSQDANRFPALQRAMQ